jgi:hypothetical protein
VTFRADIDGESRAVGRIEDLSAAAVGRDLIAVVEIDWRLRDGGPPVGVANGNVASAGTKDGDLRLGKSGNAEQQDR